MADSPQYGRAALLSEHSEPQMVQANAASQNAT